MLKYCNSVLDIVKEVLFDIVNPEKYGNEYPEPSCDNVDIAKAIYDSKWWKILFNNTDQYAYIYEPFITISIRTSNINLLQWSLNGVLDINKKLSPEMLNFIEIYYKDIKNEKTYELIYNFLNNQKNWQKRKREF